MASSKTSPVWAYFSTTTDPNYLKCNIGKCSAKLKLDKTGSTKGLWSHLKHCHKKEHEVAQLEQKEKSEGASAAKRKSDIYVVLDPSNSEQPSTSAGLPALSPMSDVSSSSFMSLQSKISDIFPPLEKYKSGHLKQKELNYLLGEWLADAMLPFNTVNNLRFRAFMEVAHSKYNLPKEKYFRTVVIPDIYKRVKSAISKILESVAVFTATSDMWSSSSNQSYVSLTIHFIDANWQRKMIVLSCQPIYETHTAENIASTLRGILEEWGLLSKIHIFVRDSGANMIAAMEEGSFDSVPCFLHTLHLVVQNGLLCQRTVIDMQARLTNFISHYRRSTMLKHKLREIQRRLNLPLHSLILGESGRWSSIVRSMKRAIEQKLAIRTICDDLDLGNHQIIQENDWKIMEKVVALLEPFEQATTFAERESASISEVIPAIKKLSLQIARADARGAQSMQEELASKIRFYFGGEGDARHRSFLAVEYWRQYSIATLLDPRFKNKFFVEKNAADQAQIVLEQLVFEQLKEQRGQPHIEAPLPEKRFKTTGGFFDDLANELECDTGATTSTVVGAIDDDALKITSKNIVSAFMQESLIRTDSDPLQFWKMKEIEMPVLAKLGKKFLSAPMGSVASEREFKVASGITGGDRINLLPENAEKLLFLKYNLRAVGYHSYRLPLQADDEISESAEAALAEKTDSSESSDDA